MLSLGAISNTPFTRECNASQMFSKKGWDDDGIFNFEGGCYAKTINLSRENEPEIYDAIKRDALLENVIIKVGI